MISDVWLIGLLIACCIVSTLSLIIGSVSLIFSWSMKMSTHKIEWRDPFPEEEGFMSLKQMNERMKKEHEDIENDFV